MKRIYLSLGSNLGDREANLRKAVKRLASNEVRVLHTSRIYETEPVGYKNQAWFLNQVVEAETALFPMQLLTRIGRVERDLGRVRTLRNGPRTIDIDILFYGAAVVETTRLEIPHPRLAERRFVLAPLAELAPDLRHPVTQSQRAPDAGKRPARNGPTAARLGSASAPGSLPISGKIILQAVKFQASAGSPNYPSDEAGRLDPLAGIAIRRRAFPNLCPGIGKSKSFSQRVLRRLQPE